MFSLGVSNIDGVLVANECIDEVVKKGVMALASLMCKLDLEKAYDRVN